ncbi:hypothetical protein BDZ88DRAFT_442476 [Geranomyces variabilis]|nr:hypothetical protein BDZ88DRAFT_442476 [Geranomyces variabilis]
MRAEQTAEAMRCMVRFVTDVQGSSDAFSSLSVGTPARNSLGYPLADRETAVKQAARKAKEPVCPLDHVRTADSTKISWMYMYCPGGEFENVSVFSRISVLGSLVSLAGQSTRHDASVETTEILARGRSFGDLESSIRQHPDKVNVLRSMSMYGWVLIIGFILLIWVFPQAAAKAYVQKDDQLTIEVPAQEQATSGRIPDFNRAAARIGMQKASRFFSRMVRGSKARLDKPGFVYMFQTAQLNIPGEDRVWKIGSTSARIGVERRLKQWEKQLKPRSIRVADVNGKPANRALVVAPGLLPNCFVDALLSGARSKCHSPFVNLSTTTLICRAPQVSAGLCLPATYTFTRTILHYYQFGLLVEMANSRRWIERGVSELDGLGEVNGAQKAIGGPKSSTVRARSTAWERSMEHIKRLVRNRARQPGRGRYKTEAGNGPLKSSTSSELNGAGELDGLGEVNGT